MIEIIVADTQPLLIDGLKSLLKNESNFSIIGAALNEVELFHQLHIKQPNLILLDTAISTDNDLGIILEIKKQYPSIKLLIFIAYGEQGHIKKALKVGVNGYVLKDISKNELLEAISKIVEGGNYFDPRITKVLMDSYHSRKKQYYRPLLTAREKEITRLIANGMSTQDIAQMLFISPLTVETHRRNIFTKLGISKVAELVRYTVEKGEIE